MSDENWSNKLRTFEVKVDPHFYQAKSHGEQLLYAKKLSEDMDRQNTIVTQNLFISAKMAKGIQKQKDLEKRAEEIRQSLVDDDYDSMALKHDIPRVTPKPNYSQRLLNREEPIYKYRKPVHVNCGYINHGLWSRRSTILEEYIRPHIKGIKLDTLDSIHVLNLLRENHKINLVDIIWSDPESNPDFDQIFRFSSFQGQILRKENLIKLEFDALTLTLVNDFLSLQKKIRQNNGVLPIFIKEIGHNIHESDYRVEATLTAITREGALHVRPLCTAADFVLAMHELLDPSVLTEGFIHIPHVMHVNMERCTSGYYRYHYNARGKPRFQFLRTRNIPGERKELKNYIFATLSFMDYYYEISDIPENKVPKDLYEFAYRVLLSLNLLFHPANEIITNMTFDIEVCESFSDIRKLGTEIIPPHLFYLAKGISSRQQAEAAQAAHEYSYRIITFNELQVQKCVSAGRRKAICEVDGMSQAFLKDFHKFFHQEWNKLMERKPLTSSMDSVLPSSLIRAQELAGKLFKKLELSGELIEEPTDSDIEWELKVAYEKREQEEQALQRNSIPDQPQSPVPDSLRKKPESPSKPTTRSSMISQRKLSKEMVVQAKQSEKLLAKHHQAKQQAIAAANKPRKGSMMEMMPQNMYLSPNPPSNAPSQPPSTRSSIIAPPGTKPPQKNIRASLIKDKSFSAKSSFIQKSQGDINLYDQMMKVARDQHIEELLKEKELPNAKDPHFSLVELHEKNVSSHYHPSLESSSLSSLQWPADSTMNQNETPNPHILLSPRNVKENELVKPASPINIAKEIVSNFLDSTDFYLKPQYPPDELEFSTKQIRRNEILEKRDYEFNATAYDFASHVDILKLFSGVDNLPQRVNDIKARKHRLLAAKIQQEKKENGEITDNVNEEKEENEINFIELREREKEREREIRKSRARLDTARLSLMTPPSLPVSRPVSRMTSAGARTPKERRAFQEKRMEEVENLLTTLLARVDLVEKTIKVEEPPPTMDESKGKGKRGAKAKTATSQVPNEQLLTPKGTTTANIPKSPNATRPHSSKGKPSASSEPEVSSPPKKSRLYQQLQGYLHRIKQIKLQKYIKRRRKQENLSKKQIMDLLFYYQSLPENQWNLINDSSDEEDDEEARKKKEQEEEERIMGYFIPAHTEEQSENNVSSLLGEYTDAQEVEKMINTRTEEGLNRPIIRRGAIFDINKQLSALKSSLGSPTSPILPTDHPLYLVSRKNSFMAKGHSAIPMSTQVIDGSIISTATSSSNLGGDRSPSSPKDEHWEHMTDSLSSVCDPNTIDENELSQITLLQQQPYNRTSPTITNENSLVSLTEANKREMGVKFSIIEGDDLSSDDENTPKKPNIVPDTVESSSISVPVSEGKETTLTIQTSQEENKLNIADQNRLSSPSGRPERSVSMMVDRKSYGATTFASLTDQQLQQLITRRSTQFKKGQSGGSMKFERSSSSIREIIVPEDEQPQQMNSPKNIEKEKSQRISTAEETYHDGAGEYENLENYHEQDIDQELTLEEEEELYNAILSNNVEKHIVGLDDEDLQFIEARKAYQRALRLQQQQELHQSVDEDEDKRSDDTILIDSDLYSLLEELVSEIPVLLKKVEVEKERFLKHLTQLRQQEAFPISEQEKEEIEHTNPIPDIDPLLKHRPQTVNPYSHYSYRYQDRIDSNLGLHRNVHEDIKKLFASKPTTAAMSGTTVPNTAAAPSSYPSPLYGMTPMTAPKTSLSSPRTTEPKERKKTAPTTAPGVMRKKEVSSSLPNSFTAKVQTNLPANQNATKVLFGVKGKTMTIQEIALQKKSQEILQEELEKKEQKENLLGQQQSQNKKNSFFNDDEVSESDIHQGRVGDVLSSHGSFGSVKDPFSTISGQTSNDHFPSMLGGKDLQFPQSLSTISHELNQDQLRQVISTPTNNPPAPKNYFAYPDLFQSNDLAISGRHLSNLPTHNTEQNHLAPAFASMFSPNTSSSFGTGIGGGHHPNHTQYLSDSFYTMVAGSGPVSHGGMMIDPFEGRRNRKYDRNTQKVSNRSHSPPTSHSPIVMNDEVSHYLQSVSLSLHSGSFEHSVHHLPGIEPGPFTDENKSSSPAQTQAKKIQEPIITIKGKSASNAEDNQPVSYDQPITQAPITSSPVSESLITDGFNQNLQQIVNSSELVDNESLHTRNKPQLVTNDSLPEIVVNQEQVSSQKNLDINVSLEEKNLPPTIPVLSLLQPSSAHHASSSSFASVPQETKPLARVDSDQISLGSPVAQRKVGQMEIQLNQPSIHTLDGASVSTLMKDIANKEFSLPLPKIVPPRSRYYDNTVASIGHSRKMIESKLKAKEEAEQRQQTAEKLKTLENIFNVQRPTSSDQSKMPENQLKSLITTSSLMPQRSSPSPPLSQAVKVNRWNYLLDYLEQSFETRNKPTTTIPMNQHQPRKSPSPTIYEDAEVLTKNDAIPAVKSVNLEIEVPLPIYPNNPSIPPPYTSPQVSRPVTSVPADPSVLPSSSSFLSPNRRNRKVVAGSSSQLPAVMQNPYDPDQEPMNITAFISKVGGQQWNKFSSNV